MGKIGCSGGQIWSKIKNDRKNMKLYMLYSPERGEYKEPSPVFFRSLVLDWQKKLAKQAFPGPPSNYVE